MILISAVLFAIELRAADVSFSTAPSAAKSDGGARMSFTVSEKTDVEVSVLNAKGEVVRHLAAGLLGSEKAPPEPLTRGLAQSIVWDGKDDFGKPVSAAEGPFKVRVRAGMDAKLSGFIGADPYRFGTLNSLATDEEGGLYVMAFAGPANQNTVTLRAFNPDGSYKRTLMPFPSDLPPNALPEIARWDDAGKCFYARNLSSLNPCFYPWGDAPAQIVSASAKGGVVVVAGKTIYRFELNGAVKAPPLPMWSKRAQLKCPNWLQAQVAASPDGRYLYYSNVAGSAYDGKTPGDIDSKWPQGRVYRHDTSLAGIEPETFFDLTLPDFAQTKYWMPSAWDKKTAAAGLAVDTRGYIYVCDLVNQEVVELSPDGKKLSATKVPWPDRVLVDSKTGTLYVSSLPVSRAGKPPAKIIKLAGRGAEAKIAAEYQLTQRGEPGLAFGNVNGKGVIWITAGDGVVCLADEGSKLVEVQTAFKATPESQDAFNRIAVDYARDEVYSSDGVNRMWRYNGLTGDGRLLKNKKNTTYFMTDVSVGYDGLLYARTGEGYSGGLERLTRELEPAPFKESGTHILSPYIYSRYGIGFSEHGIGVGPRGETYVSSMYDWCKYFVGGFGGDGKPLHGNYLKGKIKEAIYKSGLPRELDSAIVGPLPVSNGGIRVDLKGDLYVGMRLRPIDYQLPAGFEKDQAFATWTGCIIKFGPEGGTITKSGTGDDEDVDGVPKVPLNHKGVVAGAKKIYSGVGAFSGGGYGGNTSACVCRVPRFDLDRFGRIAFPNVVSNTITILDNAGNELKSFGTYGNFDSQYFPPDAKGKKPIVATSPIPLAWAMAVGFSKDYLYICDTGNRRVVRVNLVWKVEQECDVK
jgi:DNA-binding beta-propeller fold protein YncE